jgi:hypothetical protein
MKRRTFDGLLTSGGLLLVVVLLAAGGLLTWAHSFVKGQVRTQLAAEQIFFPAKGSAALAPATIGPYLNRYAGEQMLTGQQAEAYANHFIAVHLVGIGAGKTYAQLSAASQAAPTNTALAAQVEEVFKGETLRGLLLNAYAFGKMATIAGIAAIAAFIAAALMLLLSGLGLMHLRRTASDSEVFPFDTPTVRVPAKVVVATELRATYAGGAASAIG